MDLLREQNCICSDKWSSGSCISLVRNFEITIMRGITSKCFISSDQKICSIVARTCGCGISCIAAVSVSKDLSQSTSEAKEGSWDQEINVPD